jgi:xylose isomerase
MSSAFPEISKIPYEGPASKNPLAFKHYDPTKVIEGRTMADHLRFSVAYWHTFRNPLSDPFWHRNGPPPVGRRLKLR